MKSYSLIRILILVVILSLGGCIYTYKETIYGNGNVVSEDREVSSFDALKVATGIDVFIRQGDEESVKVMADENLLDVIITEVVDGQLKVYTEANIRRARSKEVYVVFQELKAIRVSSAGDVESENRITADVLDIDLSSAGDIELELDAKEINCDISSSGDAKLTGTTDVLNAELSIAGDLHAFDLVAKKCKVRVSSAGNARVHATEEFDLRSSSAGDITYTGEGRIKNIHTSSAGSVRKR